VLPAWSKMIALELLVPWSRARMYLSIYLMFISKFQTISPIRVADVQESIRTSA
jgi:hypothetical protein